MQYCVLSTVSEWLSPHLHWQSAWFSAQCGSASLSRPPQQTSRTPREHHRDLQSPTGRGRSLECPQTGPETGLLSLTPDQARSAVHLYRKDFTQLSNGIVVYKNSPSRRIIYSLKSFVELGLTCSDARGTIAVRTQGLWPTLPLLQVVCKI